MLYNTIQYNGNYTTIYGGCRAVGPAGRQAGGPSWLEYRLITCICVYIHMYMCIYIYIYIYTHICVCIHIYIYTHVYTSLSLYIHIYVYIYIYMHIHISLSLCIYIYIYTYTHRAVVVAAHLRYLVDGRGKVVGVHRQPVHGDLRG